MRSTCSDHDFAHAPLPLSQPQHVDPVIITQKVIQGVYPGVTTSELDE
jgi:hypothetical protein